MRLPLSLDQQPGLHGGARRVLSGQLAWSGSASQSCPWGGVSTDLGRFQEEGQGQIWQAEDFGSWGPCLRVDPGTPGPWGPLLGLPSPPVTGGDREASGTPPTPVPFLFYAISFPICVFSGPFTSYQVVGDLEIHKALYFIIYQHQGLGEESPLSTCFSE